jgi:hypothetical protein
MSISTSDEALSDAQVAADVKRCADRLNEAMIRANTHGLSVKCDVTHGWSRRVLDVGRGWVETPSRIQVEVARPL